MTGPTEAGTQARQAACITSEAWMPIIGLDDTPPLDPKANLLYRQQVLETAELYPQYRELISERCRKDIFWYLGAMVCQYNPLKIGDEAGLFIPWDFQVEAVNKILWAVKEQKPLVIHKSREMGASWLCLIVMDYLARFRPWQKFLMVSRSAEAVDSAGDSDSLFWKLDFIHQYQPDWLAGASAASGLKRRKMSFRFSNGSSITGQASTGNIGIGGRATAIFVDEFARIKEDYQVLHGTAHTANCRIFNSTHTGPETAFNELCQRVDIEKLQMLWHEHPDKREGLYQEQEGKVEVLDKTYVFPPDFNFIMDGKLRSPWYDAKCAEIKNKQAIARDLDDDPFGSVEQFFDVTMIRKYVGAYCFDPLWEGSVKYDSSGKNAYLLAADRGPLRLWIKLCADGSIPTARYVGGVDTSTGMGRTPSCFAVCNGETGEKVAELTHAFLSPDQFAVEVVALCYLFRDKIGTTLLLDWENNGPGGSFGKKVLELGYRHIAGHRDERKVMPTDKMIYGWQSTVESKRDLLNEYREALRGGHFLNRSKEAVEECLGYKYDVRGVVVHSGEVQKNSPSGAKMNHGDHVIADALAWKASKPMYGVRKVHLEETAPVGSLAWRVGLHEPVKTGW